MGFYLCYNAQSWKIQNLIEIAITEKLPLQVVQLDVNDDRSVKDAVSKIADEQEAIDILVNNAGYALVWAIEEISIQEFNLKLMYLALLE